MSDLIRVSIVPDNLEVNPGEAAKVTINVQNASNIVDLYSYQVEGLDAKWFNLSTLQCTLMPMFEDTITLTLSPPKSSPSITSNYPFTVKVVSGQYPQRGDYRYRYVGTRGRNSKGR